ncbi:MAG: TIGR02757 family protein [Tannerella sp.]|jgi:uncharacterized protein (TIGR02757 family)|nr:TIGR02757 family protein [Tannerella sp.]
MNIKEFLDEHVEKINTEAFIDDDPVRFPRRYNDLRDIEIVAFTVANIAWGKRSMILRDAERMLAKMGTSPFDFVMNEGYKTLGTANVHRTFFEHNLAYMLRGFKALYADYKSIDECFASLPEDKRNAWTLVETLNGYAMQANAQQTDIRCYSRNAVKSALKRVNLALRWLVRTDGIVDIGVWKSLKPCDLYIPLDVHVGNTARALGLLTRSSNDRRAVEELTAKLREFNPSDPIIYDFALFGVGVTQQSFKI